MMSVTPVSHELPYTMLRTIQKINNQRKGPRPDLDLVGSSTTSIFPLSLWTSTRPIHAWAYHKVVAFTTCRRRMKCEICVYFFNIDKNDHLNGYISYTGEWFMSFYKEGRGIPNKNDPVESAFFVHTPKN